MRRWASIPAQVDADLASEARKAMWQRTAAWLKALLEYPGFRDWKMENLRHRMTYVILPQVKPDPLGDFEFDATTLREHELVAGYVALLSAAADCRATQYYFRRYPFRGLTVTREHHLRTCCELYFSRVYQFSKRLESLIKRVERRTRSKDIRSNAMMKQFREKLDSELKIRHQIHHESAYSDFEIDSLGTSDLLKDVEQGLFVMSTANYHRISRRWQTRVKQTSDNLDVWTGYMAILMLAKCRFLWAEEKSSAS